MTLPPGPRGLPILGMLPAVRRNPIRAFTEAALRFGDVVSFKIGPRRGFLISSPDDVRHVLQDNARNYHKSPLYDKLRVVLGNGLLTSEDEFWLRQRRIAQPAFHRQRLVALADAMARTARNASSSWQSLAAVGRPIDIDEEMMQLTRTVVLQTLLGADLGPFTSSIDQAWTIVNQRIGENFWSLGFDRLPTPKYRRFQQALAILRGAVDHVIGERRRHPVEAGDLLSMLMSARDEETGEAMTDEQLRVEVMTFLLAGQETTSLALTWTWYLLSQHPDVRERFEAELDSVLDGRPPDYADLANLPYLRMLVDESMRLYPPAWGFSRQALSDDVLGGFRLPRGWLAFIIPYVLHRHPHFWKDPDSFDPERFLPERSADRPKFVFIPFGAGPRQCIGNHFALIETQLTLATLAQSYRLHLMTGHRVDPWPLITLRPRFGMPMIIERRQRAPVVARG
ncbi:MAG TPA: cytochrome P450 [Vicinamibacterales bacterium]|nr:cytochrome P450 [Vicinamibacterales bacterium]